MTFSKVLCLPSCLLWKNQYGSSIFCPGNLWSVPLCLMAQLGNFCIGFWICEAFPCSASAAKKIPATPAEFEYVYLGEQRMKFGPGRRVSHDAKHWCVSPQMSACEFSFQTELWPRRINYVTSRAKFWLQTFYLSIKSVKILVPPPPSWEEVGVMSTNPGHIIISRYHHQHCFHCQVPCLVLLSLHVVKLRH